MSRNTDFPEFVADLIKGVFQATIEVMRLQTDAFLKLLKGGGKMVQDDDVCEDAISPAPVPGDEDHSAA